MEGYHSPQVSVDVRLNTNESPFEVPDSFSSELSQRIDNLRLNRYPDRLAATLRQRLGVLHGVSQDEIFAANGSNEVLQSLLLAFGGIGRRALVFEPTYALHSHIAHVTGTSVVSVSRQVDFTLTPEIVSEAAQRHQPDVLFLCSPNNPTGTVDSPDVVEAALESTRGLVVVDEAYGQFADTSALSLRAGPGAERLVVVRTFSKTWALAGVRLGYLVADRGIVEGCEIVCLPYHLSSLTQVAGEVALDHTDEMENHVVGLIRERIRIEGRLDLLDVQRWSSSANFVLFRPNSKDGHAVWQDLVARSVLVRDCSSWDGLEGCLRVTVGTAEENDLFLKALEEVL
jgi:histidinol-phosphate aminotransferase